MTQPNTVDPELKRIIAGVLPGARVLRARAFGTDEGSGTERQLTAKGSGYGVPIRIDVQVGDRVRKLVLHGTSSNQFGHERRADRAAELLLAADTFASIPRHAPVLDVGAFRRDGSSVSLLGSEEFYLLTEFVEGRPYADDLRRIAQTRSLEPSDRARVHALVDYLVELHAQRHESGSLYQRSLRDLVGGGEGIFGIIDGYPADTPGASAAQLQELESRCLAWRWRLKRSPARLARIHGDFHPFNVLFDRATELFVLDASRGSLGDPADDVACMAVNFVFFAQGDASAWRGALAAAWREFWQRYLERSQDSELLSVVAPFLAWRLLVLACPVWYPNLSADARGRLLSFAQAALDADRFDPELAEAAFR